MYEVAEEKPAEYDLLARKSELKFRKLENIVFPPISKEDYARKKTSTGATFLDLCLKANQETVSTRGSTLKEMIKRIPLKPHKNNLPQIMRWLPSITKWLHESWEHEESLEDIKTSLELTVSLLRSQIPFAEPFVVGFSSISILSNVMIHLTLFDRITGVWNLSARSLKLLNTVLRLNYVHSLFSAVCLSIK